MRVDRLRGRVPVPTHMLWVAALLAVYFFVAAAIATAGSTKLNLAGRWSGTYSGAFSGTFKLQWKESGSKLTGSITLSYPKGRYGITGSVHGKTIKFGAVGAGATYTGTVSGTKMSGRYKTPQGGGKWSAHKCKTRTVC